LTFVSSGNLLCGFRRWPPLAAAGQYCSDSLRQSKGCTPRRDRSLSETLGSARTRSGRVADRRATRVDRLFCLQQKVTAAQTTLETDFNERGQVKERGAFKGEKLALQ